MGEARFPAPRLLVLWDIDYTLIDDRGVSKEIYAHAFELLTGRRAEHPAPTFVRTEPEIMMNMLLVHGIKPTPEYATRMPEVLEASTIVKTADLREHSRELPGARDALVRFQESPEIIQSVLSGNIKPNAITRLSVFGLDSYIDFEVGGYGSDDHVPGNLIGLARERARMKYGVQLGKAETVLIGSTLRDVRTGLNGGAHVVSIATGPDSMDALHSAGADIVLPDLRDTDAVAEAVTSFAR